MNIKPPRVGGLANSKRILAVCAEARMPAWVGSMLETSIGTASNLAFASLPGITLPCDAFPSARFYAEEISDVTLELSRRGVMRPSATTSGTITPNPQRLRARTISHAKLGTGSL
jgi:O-succinylbenzoate synthase